MDARQKDAAEGLKHLVWILGEEATPTAVARAEHMLLEFGSLGALLAASPGRQLKAASGNEHIVANLRRCSDVITHVLRLRLPSGPLLTNCSRTHDYLRGRLAYSPVEQFRVLYLDVGKRLIRDDLLSVGTVDRVSVHAREVIRRAIDLGATALIMVHNHPGGGLAPSAADERLTSRIAYVAKELQIELIDHLIVSTEGIVSLRTLGLLS